ncbi:exopolysaccharide production repressor protein [Rhizobium sp. SGZ-381]|uniref:exopolysaccharide production repressor protein n=1 Tax=Rhizobium sp. SGZ-381 TaxID=3342800 RepID=UPI00366CCAB2
MYGPRVIASMSIVLVVFAVATYFLQGSAVATFWQTILCAILLQTGYFLCVLFLVSRERAARVRKAAESGSVSRSSDGAISGEIRPSTSHLKVSDH